MLSTILIIVLILLLVGALPTWPYSANWGYWTGWRRGPPPDHHRGPGVDGKDLAFSSFANLRAPPGLAIGMAQGVRLRAAVSADVKVASLDGMASLP